MPFTYLLTASIELQRRIETRDDGENGSHPNRRGCSGCLQHLKQTVCQRREKGTFERVRSSCFPRAQPGFRIMRGGESLPSAASSFRSSELSCSPLKAGKVRWQPECQVTKPMTLSFCCLCLAATKAAPLTRKQREGMESGRLCQPSRESLTANNRAPR